MPRILPFSEALCGRRIAATRFCLAAAILGPTGAAAWAGEPALIPRPALVTLKAGRGPRIGAASRIVVPPRDTAARSAAAWLRAQLRATTGLRPALITGRPRAGDIDFATLRSAPGGNEGYSLVASARGVSIRASGSAGLFYGGVTLWQLLTGEQGRGAVRLRAMAIADRPRFAWRGLMLDSARHMQSPAYIERFLDWMALHKLNTLHWHLTDDQGWRIEIRRYPRLTAVGAWRRGVGPDRVDANGAPVVRYGGYYTQRQIRGIVAFAARRHITIVPELDMPGHSTALIAAYPALGVPGFLAEPVASDWGLLPEVLNVDESTFAMVENILSEVMALFPGRYIHLGGDEVDKSQWKASPAVQARMRSLGIADEDALERWFIGRLARFVKAKGRRLVGWDEIQEGESGADLDKGAVVMSWHGGAGAAKAAAGGHDVVVAEAPIYYLDHRQSDAADEPPGWSDVVSLEDVYRHDPVPPALPAAQAAHLLGLQGQMWTERARKQSWVTALVWPRAAAIAEIGWTPPGRLDWTDFEQRMAVQRQRYRLVGLDAGAMATPAAPASPSRHRSSLALDFCNPGGGLVLEAPPPGKGLVKVVIHRPCWVWRGVDLGGVGRIEIGAVQLPFTYRMGSASPVVHMPRPRTPAGEIEIRLDRPDGRLLVSMPLRGFEPARSLQILTAAVQSVGGTHDLYLVPTGPDIDSRKPNRPPLTIVDWIDLR